MKVGISTASLFGRLYNEDALPLLNEWHVTTAEVFLTSFSEYEPDFARTLAGRKGELNAYSVHVLNTQFEPQLYNDHPRVKADAYAWLEKAMRSARILGAERYTFHGPARLKRTYKEDIPRIGRLTQEIFSFCKRFGVTLCYENVEWAFVNRTGIFSELVKYCPALLGVLDIKQARLSGYDYREYLAEMGSRISHVHVSDVDAEGRMCLPGRGAFDFDELFRRLADVGFRGPVLIENYGRDYKELKEIKDSLDFLSERAEKYNF